MDELKIYKTFPVTIFKKINKLVVLFILISAVFGSVDALGEEKEVSNPIVRIMEESEGKITIDIPSAILPNILEMPTGSKNNSKVNLKSGINRLNGYRIQVFSDGRNQSTLESRAKARGNMVLAKFPKYKGQIYTFSNSPNWYTRVGNFRTTEEATNAMNELKQAFPNLSSEMRIVKSQIVLIK